MNHRPALLLTVFFLTGCAGGGRSFVPATQPAEPAAVPDTVTGQVGTGVTYHAYGDSITYGFLLPDPLQQAYPYLVAAKERVSAFADYGISGQKACDLAKWQIAPNHDSPTLTNIIVYTVLIGSNDVRQHHSLLHEPVFVLCDRAALSWLAVPSAYKVLAGNSGTLIFGRGAYENIDGWKTWTTGSKGSWVSFTISTTRLGPVYAWPIIDDDSAATFSYSVDGVVRGESASKLSQPIATEAGTTRTLGFLRIANIPKGKHTIRFTQTNPGAGGFSIVGVGAPTGTSTGRLPLVLSGTIPYQYYRGKSATCTEGNVICDGYVSQIVGNVNLLRTDGLDVKLFDTRKYMLGTAKEMANDLHPNALGQMEIGESVEAVW